MISIFRDNRNFDIMFDEFINTDNIDFIDIYSDVETCIYIHDLRLDNLKIDSKFLKYLDAKKIFFCNCKINFLELCIKSKLEISDCEIETIKSEKTKNISILHSCIQNMYLSTKSIKCFRSNINNATFNKISSIIISTGYSYKKLKDDFITIKMCPCSIQMSTSFEDKTNIKFASAKKLRIGGKLEILDIETLTELNNLINEGKEVELGFDLLCGLLIEHRSRSTKSATK